MNNSDNQSRFLATTALEEFWDTSKKMVFLGNWCLRYSRKAAWEQLHGEVMEGPWEGKDKLYNAYLHASKIYEEILPLMAQALNSIHGVDYSIRYWRIVIGPWLFYYIHIMYDRYISLCNVFELYPEITTYGLTENNYIIPKDTLDFLWLTRDDPYNLQLYTKILVAMGKSIIKKNIQMASTQLVSPVLLPKNSMKRVLIQKITKMFLNKDKIMLYNPYFSRSVEGKIFFATYGKVLPYGQFTVDVSLKQIDTQARRTLYDFFSCTEGFKGVLKETLSMDIPQSYIEAFNYIGSRSKRLFPVFPKAIYSAVSWYTDEPFKQWAALASENGTKLIGLQHGGNYGSIRFMALEDHEAAITDKFHSWGWNRSGCFSKVIPMPATKLAKRKSFRSQEGKNEILFVGTLVFRYLVRIQDLNSYQFENYLQWQFRFVDAMLQTALNKLRIRLHKIDDGWEIRQRWKDRFPDLNIEDRYDSFLESLENCRLYVCDHLSTTFMEALSANKPTILFWDPTVHELRDEATPYYDELRSKGILYDSPEKAACAVNTIYDDIEGWWDEASRQTARNRFCGKFAKVSDNFDNEWISEFKREFFNNSKQGKATGNGKHGLVSR